MKNPDFSVFSYKTTSSAEYALHKGNRMYDVVSATKNILSIAKAKGYKITWIYHHLKTKDDIIKYAEYKGYHKNWIEHQIQIRQNERK